MRVKNVGVYGLFPYVSGVPASTVFSDEFIRWLFDAQANLSLRRYWRDVSGGELDINASVFGYFLLEGQSYIDRLCQPSRGPSANEAVRILFEIGQDPSPFDGLVFIIAGRQVDGGSNIVTFGGKQRPFCYFDDLGSHSFMAHELGHLLGHDHPFDTALANPTYKYGEYGDPTCIMSAENFGGSAATFIIPAGSRVFANGSARFWQSAGPGVSMATLWRYAPDFPAPQAFSTQLPASAAPTPIRISRAGSAGVCLVTMPVTGANAWYTAEYRPQTAWDRGLAAPKAGVVIHQIRNQIGTAADGASWPKLNRVCLAGVIPVPSTGDLDWNDGAFGVRIVNSSPSWVDLIVGATLPAAQYVIVQADTESTPLSDSPAEPIEVSRTTSDCGVHAYTAVQSNMLVKVAAQGISSGFNAPQFRYELNGVALNGWTAAGANASGLAVIAVNVEVPTTLTTHAVQMRNITVSYVASGNAITITMPGGDGAYTVSLTCFAADNPAPADVGVASGPVSLPIVTATIHLPPDAISDMGKCIARMADELRHRRTWPGEEEHPNWHLPDLDQNWARDDFALVGQRILSAAALKSRFPAMATGAFTNLAAELGMSVDDLQSLANRLARDVDR